MELIELGVLLSALLCSLVTGLVFTFAIIVMPGTMNLGDLGFLQAFKAMDRIIQNNHPVFLFVWLGSAVALLCSTVLGLWQLVGVDRVLINVACATFILGVHLPTMIVNIPLNNRLQSLDLDAMDAPELQEVRAHLESRWLKWNTIRTVLAVLATILLLVLLMRL